MNSKKYSKFVGFGYFVIALVLIVVALPVAADDSGTEILPEDAKLGHYISLRTDSTMAPVDAKLGQYITDSAAGTEMAPVDVKLGQYIVDNFDYAAAGDIQVYRWQAMAEFYSANDMLNNSSPQAAKNDAGRWSAVDDYYSRHGLRNVPVIVAVVE